MKNNWDSENYTDNFSFVGSYGKDVTNLISAPKDSRVVDLGCGNGVLTAVLAEMGYNTLGIDASPDMLKKARELYPYLNFLQADACSFTLNDKADVIFSNAVFHWISDHEALVNNISSNLKIGGELVFEFGGKGCAETVHSALGEAFARYGYEYENKFNFCSVGEFAPILERHGFRVEYAVLFDRPTVQKGADGLKNWINMFVTDAFSGISEHYKNKITDDAVEICRPKLCKNSEWIVDYVRLRMRAVKVE